MSGHHAKGARPAGSVGIPGFVMDAGEPFLCRADPDAYSAAGVRPAEARALCSGCGFLEACRVYGLEHPELYGVWGGTTRRERQGMRSRGGAGERGPPCWSRVVGRCLRGVSPWW